MKKHHPGVTLVEIAATLGVIGVLSAGAMMAFVGLEQQAEAQMEEAVRASLQATITQAVSRCHQNAGGPASCNVNTPPTSLNQTAVINSLNLRGGAAQQVTIAGLGGGQYLLTFNKSGNNTTFQVQQNGDVVLASAGGSTGGGKGSMTGQCGSMGSGIGGSIPCNNMGGG